MVELRQFQRSIQEFPDQQGLLWNIGTNQPGEMLILECLEIDDRIEVRTISDEVGYHVIGEATADQILKFVDQAIKYLPDAVFTTHLREYVERKKVQNK